MKFGSDQRIGSERTFQYPHFSYYKENLALFHTNQHYTCKSSRLTSRWDEAPLSSLLGRENPLSSVRNNHPTALVALRKFFFQLDCWIDFILSIVFFLDPSHMCLR